MTISKKLSFLICFLLPALAVIGESYGGYFHLLVPATVFLFLPVIDLFLGKDTSNPGEDAFLRLQNEKYFRYITYIWAFLQVGFVLWAIYAILVAPKSTIEFILFALSVGIVTGGIGITIGHELGHKPSRLEQFLSKMIYMTVCYMHFYIEHNKGHHINVSTHGDPATSRKGESFYKFYPRTVIGAITSAWNIETKRLSKVDLQALHYRNEMIWYFVITLSFASIIFLGGSFLRGSAAWDGLGFFFLQSIVAFTLLELVNYIEHYGLNRKEITPGKFEKVLPIHSWNQNYFLSNAFLFQLQRHSDHHANAGRRYQALRNYEEAPQLPFGYEVMLVIALVPPLWFRLMNPILEGWENQSKK